MPATPASIPRGVSSSNILIGQLAARGTNSNGEFNQTKALAFTRAVYCVDSRLRALRGPRRPPSAAPGAPRRSFARQHPGLFQTSFGIHPYPQGLPPTQDSVNNPDYGTFNHLGTLERTLDGAQGAYGSHHRMAVYNNEFGYVTHPPNLDHTFASPAQAAVYMNQAEYLSWRDGRVASTMQFLLRDPSEAQAGTPTPVTSTADWRARTGSRRRRSPPTGCRCGCRPRPVGSGRRLEVWGDVRPAHVYAGTQYAYVQYQRGSHGAYKNVAKVKLTSSLGYLDVGVAFPASGNVRIAWTYPQSSTVYSRTQSISVR